MEKIKATEKQIKYLFWLIEFNAQDPIAPEMQIKDAAGNVRNIKQVKNKTCELIYNNLPAENKYGYFYQAMQDASAEQASYLIQLFKKFQYQKAVKILRELKIITN
ncbi:MAG: hypothetical protein AAB432_03220 [Patescibacteria group bacterium]